MMRRTILFVVVAVLAVMVIPGLGIGQTLSNQGGPPSDVYSQTWPGDFCGDKTLDKNGTTVMEQQVNLQVESNLLVYFMFEFGFDTARQEALIAFGLDGSGPDQEWGIAASASTTAGKFSSRQSGTMMWTFQNVPPGEHSVQAFARVSTGLAGMNGCALNVFVVPVDTESGARVSTPIGTGRIQLDSSLVGPDSYQLTAFVPTGSLDPGCLVTLAESNFAVAGTTVYCGVREFGEQKGLVIHIFLPTPAPGDVSFAVNVYQPFAQGYGEPVYYDGG